MYTQQPTISLPFHNPTVQSIKFSSSVRARQRRRHLVIAAAALLVFFLTIFFSAAPLYRRRDTSEVNFLTLRDANEYKNTLRAIANIYDAPPAPEGLDHLVVVAAHGIVVDRTRYNEDEGWVLETYQIGQSHVFVEHIKKGIELASDDRKSLLIFSGGQTRASAGPRGEAESYYGLAQHIYASSNTMELLDGRIVTEDFARDSYENLLFSLCRFFEVVGRYPTKVTVVGFEFKRKRFQELHRKALRFPNKRFHYVGIDPPKISNNAELELKNAFLPFQEDPYACGKLSILAEKRRNRNPFRRMHGYAQSNLALRSLLSWCPNGQGQKWYDQGILPWEGD